MPSNIQLGELLVRAGYLDHKQLQVALTEAKRTGERLGSALLRLGILDGATVARALGKQRGFDPIIPETFDLVDPQVIAKIPAELAHRHRAVPVRILMQKGPPGELYIAMADPNALEAVDELTFAANMRIHPCVAPEQSIHEALERFYPMPRAYQTREVSLEHGIDPSVTTRDLKVWLIDSGATLEVHPDGCVLLVDARQWRTLAGFRQKVCGVVEEYVAERHDHTRQLTVRSRADRSLLLHFARRGLARQNVAKHHVPGEHPGRIDAQFQEALRGEPVRPPPSQPSLPAVRPQTRASSRPPSRPPQPKPQVVVGAPATQPAPAPEATMPAHEPHPVELGAPSAPMEELSAPPYPEAAQAAQAQAMQPQPSLPSAPSPAVQRPPQDVIEADGMDLEAIISAHLNVPRPSESTGHRATRSPTLDELPIKESLPEEIIEELRASGSAAEIADALYRGFQGRFGAFLMLVAKDNGLRAFKGFSENAADDVLDGISFGLERPSMFKTVFETGRLFLGAAAGDIKVETRLWKLLGAEPPSEILIVPVKLGRRVVNLLYLHPIEGRHFSENAGLLVEQLAHETEQRLLALLKNEG